MNRDNCDSTKRFERRRMKEREIVRNGVRKMEEERGVKGLRYEVSEIQT
jgi:hypothetical protein